MKVYLASSIAYMNELAIPLMNKLRVEGVTITHDWTEQVTREKRTDAELDDETAYRIAQQVLDGIKHADVFWLVVPPIGGQGCFFEYGYAMARKNLGKPVFVSGPRRTVFQSLVRHDRAFAEHLAALAEILAWGRKEGLL